MYGLIPRPHKNGKPKSVLRWSSDVFVSIASYVNAHNQFTLVAGSRGEDGALLTVTDELSHDAIPGPMTKQLVEEQHQRSCIELLMWSSVWELYPFSSTFNEIRGGGRANATARTPGIQHSGN
jgi:hypothetical protein